MTGPGSVTYSEGALGGLVSPWNPMVVTFPLLLLVLLGAAAFDRSPLSLLGAVLVGSFIVQTNVSSLVVVAVVVLVALAATVVTGVHDRRSAPGADRSPPVHPTRRLAWWIAGSAVFVVMWLPPVVQQVTNHPGNLTLMVRFFTAGLPTPSLADTFNSVVSLYGVLAVGPSEVMSSYLGHTPLHAAAAATATTVAVAGAAVLAGLGLRQRNRFAAGLGLLGLAGFVAMVVAVGHVVGIVYGYLLIWGIAIPLSTCIGFGMVRIRAATTADGRAPSPSPLSSTGVRVAASLVAVAASLVVCIRVADLPALAAVSDPEVGQLAALVVPALHGAQSVFVNDSGAGATPGARLLDVERFIGLVNQLDQRGYHPTVNRDWNAEFGPGFEDTGTESHSVELSTWTPSSAGLPGYVGRAGDLAVTVRPAVDGRSDDPADRRAT